MARAFDDEQKTGSADPNRPQRYTYSGGAIFEEGQVGTIGVPELTALLNAADAENARLRRELEEARLAVEAAVRWHLLAHEGAKNPPDWIVRNGVDGFLAKARIAARKAEGSGDG